MTTFLLHRDHERNKTFVRSSPEWPQYLHREGWGNHVHRGLSESQCTELQTCLLRDAPVKNSTSDNFLIANEWLCHWSQWQGAFLSVRTNAQRDQGDVCCFQNGLCVLLAVLFHLNKRTLVWSFSIQGKFQQQLIDFRLKTCFSFESTVHFTQKLLQGHPRILKCAHSEEKEGRLMKACGSFPGVHRK